MRRRGFRVFGFCSALALSALLAGCGTKTLPETGPEPAAIPFAGGRPPTLPEPPPEPPPRSEPRGVYHTLLSGQTLSALSRVYEIPVSTLMDVNGISDPTRIPAGSRIFVPGADHELPVPSPSSAALAWPLHGRITSGFGPRGKRSYHAGIDIDGVSGESIEAAADGVVVEAGRDGDYGLTILVDHGAGLVTRYAHASRLLVKRGDEVRRGEKIAEVGRTGNAHGSHLHFEVLQNGRAVDPRTRLSR